MKGELTVKFAVTLTPKQREQLEVVAKEKYRLWNMSHAIRLMIEDAYKELPVKSKVGE